jgi:hypothetical protein
MKISHRLDTEIGDMGAVCLAKALDGSGTLAVLNLGCKCRYFPDP